MVPAVVLVATAVWPASAVALAASSPALVAYRAAQAVSLALDAAPDTPKH